MDAWPDMRRRAAIDHLRASEWLRQVEWYAEIDSTNLHARREVEASRSQLPALFVADRQTAGRGRSDRQWWSPDGCLMLSLLVDQSMLPTHVASWSQLSLVVGVAAANAAEPFITPARVQLKWPNDLYVGERKLAGILIEAMPVSVASSKEQQMVFIIGLGLNVHVDFKGAPDDVQKRACSLSEFASEPLTTEDVLVQFIEQMEKELDRWRADESEWWQKWSERSLLTERTVHLRIPGDTQLIGHCEGIDATGRLLIRDATGLHSIQSADVLQWSR